MNPLRETARALGLGRAALALYHRPIGLIRESIAEGGPIEQRRMAAGHAEMRRAAATLPRLQEPQSGPDAKVAFLSGQKYWHQTLFCFVSLQSVCPYRITPVVFDDGTLDSETRRCMQRVIPWISFIDRTAIDANLDRVLPARTFPALRARRLAYPHLRKLTDIHVAAQRFTLVLDSDMLFFREPTELLGWFAKPHPLYMQDVATMYGYPSAFLAELAGAPIPEPVNVGLYALDAASIDWDRVEHWCRRQLNVYGPHYLQEQALTAMAFTGVRATALSRADYVVRPCSAEGRAPTAILHHYVAHSKRSYYQYGWRQILKEYELAMRPTASSAASADVERNSA